MFGLKIKLVAVVVVLAASSCVLKAGPYSLAFDDSENPYDAPIPGWIGPAGEGFADVDPWYPNPGNYLNPAIIAWADVVVDYYTPGAVDAGWDVPEYALGAASGDEMDIVSLGEMSAEQITAYIQNPSAAGIAKPGYITLGFDTVIADGTGADFTVFENGFSLSGASPFFAELAFVEVSTDGVYFARFESVSLTAEPDPEFHRYMSLGATDVYNLAGKHANAHGYCWGTPFDLVSLEGDPLVQQGFVDLDNINYVRIVDIPGDGSFTDSQGNAIYDAWPTYGSGGFDLDAVGVLNTVQPPVSGDIDGDGDVDIFDFLVLKSNYGSTNATYSQGDLDGDGDVDILDFLILKSNYGSGSGYLVF